MGDTSGKDEVLDGDHIEIDMDTPGLVRSTDTSRPNAEDFLKDEAAENAQRDAIFDKLNALRDRGAKFRLPKYKQPVAALQKRLDDITKGFEASKKAAASKAPPSSGSGSGSRQVKTEPKAKPAPASPKTKRVRHRPQEDSDYTSVKAAPKAASNDMSWVHAAVYGGCNLIGTGATFVDMHELSDFGDNVWANKDAFNPVISEVAKELGIDGDMPIPAPVQLVMMLVGTAGGTYLAKHPENPATLPTLMALQGFLHITVAAGGKKKPAKEE